MVTMPMGTKTKRETMIGQVAGRGEVGDEMSTLDLLAELRGDEDAAWGVLAPTIEAAKKYDEDEDDDELEEEEGGLDDEFEDEEEFADDEDELFDDDEEEEEFDDDMDEDDEDL